jgi:hypothetical protein
MNKRYYTLFLNGEYLFTSVNDPIFSEKYKGQTTFFLEDTAENVLGENWKTDQRPIIKVFRQRMFWKEQKIDDIKEPVLYGKIKEFGSPFALSELVLFSEIAFDKSLEEFEKLKKEKRILIKKIKK